MKLDGHGGEMPLARRMARIGVEMPVRCKHGLVRSTVMLKDLTPFGARIEGIGLQCEGDSITLMLPGMARTMTAFVVWSAPQSSGLEFAWPLGEREFAALIADYAIGQFGTRQRCTAPMRRFAA